MKEFFQRTVKSLQRERYSDLILPWENWGKNTAHFSSLTSVWREMYTESEEEGFLFIAIFSFDHFKSNSYLSLNFVDIRIGRAHVGTIGRIRD